MNNRMSCSSNRRPRFGNIKSGTVFSTGKELYMLSELLIFFLGDFFYGGINILPLGEESDFDGEHGSHLTPGVKGESSS